MNLAELIRRHAQGRPRQVAIEFGDVRWRYADLWASVAHTAGRLEVRGVGEGTRVAVALGDHPGHVAALFAIAAVGAVAVPVDARATPSERRAVRDAFGATLALCDEGDAAADDDALPIVPARAAPAVSFEPASTDRDDQPWLISLSSGTTGRPKGALVTHSQMHARFVTQWVSLGFSSTERFALVTPMYFGAGRSFAMATLAAGATLIVIPPPQPPEALVEALNARAASATFLVPTMMRRLLAVTGEPPLLGGLRRLLISGERFHASEVETFRAGLCPHLLGYYASSEGGGISVLQPPDFAHYGGTVGQAAYGVELQVVDDDDQACAPGGIGRVRYRGPGVSVQGVDEDGRAQPAAAGGWFYPGDLASVDGDGFLTLHGREDDVLVRAGVNVYPAEIEAALSAHESVDEAAVVGAPSVTHGQEAVAYVTGGATPEDLAAWCATRLAPYKRPARIVRLASMPRTAAAKLDKRQLRVRARADLGEAHE